MIVIIAGALLIVIKLIDFHFPFESLAKDSDVSQGAPHTVFKYQLINAIAAESLYRRRRKGGIIYLIAFLFRFLATVLLYLLFVIIAFLLHEFQFIVKNKLSPSLF